MVTENGPKANAICKRFSGISAWRHAQSFLGGSMSVREKIVAGLDNLERHLKAGEYLKDDDSML